MTGDLVARAVLGLLWLLQRLPLEHTKATEEVWEHLAILAGTLNADELLEADPATIMRRLFADEAWHLQTAQPINIACRCSREGISLLLLSLGRLLRERDGGVLVLDPFAGDDAAERGDDLIAARQGPRIGFRHVHGVGLSRGDARAPPSAIGFRASRCPAPWCRRP